MNIQNDLNLLDEAKARLGLRTDTEFAGWLELSSASLSNVRNQRAELSPENKLRLLELLELDFTEEEFLSLLPRKTREKILVEKIDLFDPERGKNLVADSKFWIECVEKCKAAFEVETDAEFAREMSISHSLIAGLRAGDRELNLVAKFRILDKLAYTASRNLLANLLPIGVRERFLNFDNSRFKRRKPRSRKK